MFSKTLVHFLSECYKFLATCVFCVFFKHKIYDRVAIDRMNIDTCSRTFILKIHSLTHNQLAAERFLSLIKYACYSSGYISKDSGYFENVYGVCFSFDNDLCSTVACSDFSFICCSHYHHILTFL